LTFVATTPSNLAASSAKVLQSTTPAMLRPHSQTKTPIRGFSSLGCLAFAMADTTISPKIHSAIAKYLCNFHSEVAKCELKVFIPL
jgi:hypothetical protein